MVTKAEFEAQEEEENGIKPTEGGDDDEFDKTFDALVEGNDTEEKTAEDKEADAAAKLEAEKESSKNESLFVASPETDTEKKEETHVPTPEEEIANLKSEVAKEKQRSASWEGRINAADKRAKAAELAAQQSQETDKSQSTTDALPNGDDELVIKEFTEEFPALEQPIQLMIKAEAQKIIDASLKDLKPKIDQVTDTVANQTYAAHQAAITTAHQDWKAIRDDGRLRTWIDAQPGIIKNSLNQVYEKGNTAEVIEMFDAYTKSNSITPNREIDPNPKPNLKAEKLLAVPHQPGALPKDQKKKAAKDDFDGAWEEAISKK